MLDVHPAHHAANTWRDFFIHIATICVGLLIAIALEQSIEALHHAHQRRELIEDLRSECEHNRPVFEEDVNSYSAHAAWESQSATALMLAAPKNGYVTVTLPAFVGTQYSHAPSGAVWSVARANGKVALLPENLAEIYDRVDHQGEEFLLSNRKANEVKQEIPALATLYGIQIKPDATVRVSPEARDTVAGALARASSANRSVLLWVLYWQGACKAELDNVQTRDAISPYLDAADRTLSQK
jgi:hypothetical protein